MVFKKIYFAADHAGVEMKRALVEKMQAQDYIAVDLGTYTEDSVDYPDYAVLVVEKMKEDLEAVGVLICGSGIGMCIAANRYPYIRAALCHTAAQTQLARQHNDANVLCLASREMNITKAYEYLKVFLETPFEKSRHRKRVEKLGQIGL